MTITTIELFQLIRTIIITCTDIDPNNVILAEQNRPAPEGQYCTVEPKRSTKQRGQANIYRDDIVGEQISIDIRAQIICDANIQFYRGNAYDQAEKLNQCNKRPDISELLFKSKVGWKEEGMTVDLTSLQSGNFEQRAGKMLTLMYETANTPVALNNILIVPYEVSGFVEGEPDELLAEGEIE